MIQMATGYQLSRREKENLEWAVRANKNLDILKLKFPDDKFMKKTNFVFQREAVIIENPKADQRLYTFGIVQCVALVIIGERTDKSQIGMAHVDGPTSEESIRDFYSRFAKPETYLIGGDIVTVMKILNAVGSSSIKGINFGLEKLEEYKGIGVDGLANLYYGCDDKLLKQNLKSMPEPDFSSLNMPLNLKIIAAQ